MRLLLFILCIATGAQAEGTLSAAGRLQNDTASCSAALIAPNLVLTAAHCIAEGDAGQFHFRPNSNFIRHFPTSHAVRHQLYNGDGPWRLRFDFALVELSIPVPSDIAVPFTVGEEAQKGEYLFLLSWRLNEKPRQRRCQVIPGVSGLVTLACPVKGGESGAPVVRKTENGFELVAVVSSRTVQIKQPIAQASNLRNRLIPLIDRLKEVSEGS